MNSNSFIGKLSRAPRLSASSRFIVVPVRGDDGSEEPPVYVNLVLSKGQTIDLIDRLQDLVSQIGKEIS